MFAERRLGAQQRKQLGDALHDLCQPLTTLQCRLEMASLTNTIEAYHEAAEAGMAECGRLAESVELMRAILHRSTRKAENTKAQR
jgi:signal transduction histidine kinase